MTKAGFKVDLVTDANLPQLKNAISRFGSEIRKPEVRFGIFYYAGHGLQQGWRNYLVPISANISRPEDVSLQAVDISTLLKYMDAGKERSFLVILDACRDDPLGGYFKPELKGLSQFDAPSGSLLAFATAPGRVASDGQGEHGLYTAYLLREFSVPGVKLEDAFKRIRLGVRIASKGAQVPWESTSLEEDIYLFPGNPRKLSEAERNAEFDREMEAWARVRSSANPLVLADFIREFPSGIASELAQSRLSRLLREGEGRVAPTSSESRSPHINSAFRGVARAMKVALNTASDAKSLPQYEATAAQPVEIPSTPFYKGYSEHLRKYSVGDEMHINVIDGLTKISTPMNLKVTEVNEGADRVVFNEGEYVSDLMGNIVTNLRGTLNTPRQFYPADLFVGKKWKTRFKQSRPNGTTYTFDYDLKVVAREVVTVPAGTFNTYKIEARGFNMDIGASLERNIWVSPGVNADIVHEIKVRLRNSKWDQWDRQELASYTQKVR